MRGNGNAMKHFGEETSWKASTWKKETVKR
jgi:hypothetical protein